MTEYPEQLPCGAELESLLVQVADHEPASDPEHQASCAYCQAALESLRREWMDVQALAREPVAIPGGVTARIMLATRELAVLLADSTLIDGPRVRLASVTSRWPGLRSDLPPEYPGSCSRPPGRSRRTRRTR